MCISGLFSTSDMARWELVGFDSACVGGSRASSTGTFLSMLGAHRKLLLPHHRPWGVVFSGWNKWPFLGVSQRVLFDMSPGSGTLTGKREEATHRSRNWWTWGWFSEASRHQQKKCQTHLSSLWAIPQSHQTVTASTKNKHALQLLKKVYLLSLTWNQPWIYFTVAF